jgi:N-acetylated-alpha-linked acidic dipeptidase
MGTAGQHSRKHAPALRAPHNVGSPYDKDNAEWMLSKFKEWGFDAQIENFYVLFPTPKERLVELVGPTKFTASLQEPVVPEDPTSNQTAEQLPTYNAYSGDGDVTGPLVYVNYGTAKTMKSWTGWASASRAPLSSPATAQPGAASSPKSPPSTARSAASSTPTRRRTATASPIPTPRALAPKDGVQRGGVNDTAFPGDPLTPGVGATKDAKRLDIKDTPIITKIPVIPISYADATPLLSAITGKSLRPTGAAACPSPTTSGPERRTDAATVHMKMFSNWDTKTLYDVIAKIPGSVEPDEWVIRGNHHDAWVNGAEDPISGASAELEEARSLGELLKQGWKPRRTIVYCVWDGEEPGLLGSTEWVETISLTCRNTPWHISIPTTTRAAFSWPAAHRTYKPSRAAWRNRSRIRRPHFPCTSERTSTASPKPKRGRARRFAKAQRPGARGLG